MPEDLSLNLEEVFTTPDGSTPADVGGNPEPQQQAQPAASQDGAEQGGGAATVSLPESWTARAQQMGLQLEGIDSPDKFTDYLLDQFAQVRPYADYGRSALASPQTQQVGQPQSGQAAQDEGVAEEFDEDKFFSEAWQVPQLSPAASFLLEKGAFELNELGMIAPAKGFESLAMPHLQEVQAYQQSKAQQNAAFAENPVKFMAEKLLPYLEHKFSGKFQSFTEQRFQEYQNQSFEDKFVDQHKSWLYTPDGKAFTNEGTKFREAIQQLRAKGISDPETLADWGMKLAGINPQAAAPANQPAAPAAGTPPTPEGDSRARDEHGRFLPAGTPAPKPTKQESFLDEVKKKAAGGANQGGRGGDNASDFIVQNEGELDNMFNTAWQEYAGAK